MDITRMTLGVKDPDTVLSCVMFAFVALAAGAVLFLLARHHRRKRRPDGR